MRIVRFQKQAEAPKYGWLLQDKVGEISGDIFGRYRRREAQTPLTEVKLLPPSQPSKIVCVGRNYVEHAKELGNEVPKVPRGFRPAAKKACNKSTSRFAGKMITTRPENAKQIVCTTHDILHRGFNLMAGNGLLLMRINSAIPCGVVRRVTDHQIKGGRGKSSGKLTKVPMHYGDPFGKAIERNGALSHVGQARLNLNPHNRFRLCLSGKNERDYAAAGSQVNNECGGQPGCKMGKQNGIEGKPVALFLLNYAYTPLKKLIKFFIFPDADITAHEGSISSPGTIRFITSPLKSFG